MIWCGMSLVGAGRSGRRHLEVDDDAEERR